MAPPTWASTEETAWLNLQLPEYVSRQATKKLYKFWPPCSRVTLHFPPHAKLGLPTPSDLGDAPMLTDAQMDMLGDAMRKKKKQLENWFRHKRSRMVSVGALQRRSESSLANALFKLKPMRHRQHQPIEIFQKQNPDLINAALDEAGYNGINEEQMSKEVDGPSSSEGAAEPPVAAEPAHNFYMEVEPPLSLRPVDRARRPVRRAHLAIDLSLLSPPSPAIAAAIPHSRASRPRPAYIGAAFTPRRPNIEAPTVQSVDLTFPSPIPSSPERIRLLPALSPANLSAPLPTIVSPSVPALLPAVVSRSVRPALCRLPDVSARSLRHLPNMSAPLPSVVSPNVSAPLPAIISPNVPTAGAGPTSAQPAAISFLLTPTKTAAGRKPGKPTAIPNPKKPTLKKSVPVSTPAASGPTALGDTQTLPLTPTR
ncbi:hypothetical protein B0H10DRAFT_2230711 [Mycena sp. CBHHK59/15]|nr:hypothetical protein B0H10DRAFT_2230711 [Mycena sp. CBHHK59/15]